MVIAMSLLNASNADDVIREPAKAGGFYEADAQELSDHIDQMLAEANSQVEGRPRVLFVPHAGYIYSGSTAAKAYKLLEGESYDTVILVGPCHRRNIDGAIIWDGKAWRTPLGESRINRELAAKIASEHPKFKLAHNCHAKEHSLEVQIPFLQKVLPQAKIVPILMNDRSMAHKLAKAITKYMDSKTVLILSSDLSHFYTAEQANEIDGRATDIMQRQNPVQLKEMLDNGTVEMCGGAAYITGLYAGYELGHPKMHLLGRAHSGETSGDNSRVVGYFSGAVTNEEALTAEQKDILLQYAKSVIRKHYGLETEDIDISDPAFDKVKGVFITLRSFPKSGKAEGPLRGCLGHIMPVQSIRKDVAEMTISSALNDSRFPPVTKDELESMTLEISILNPPTKIKSHQEIVPGMHGVVIRKGRSSGVFLPEVMYSFENKEDFLSELCSQKAGLPRNCWHDDKLNEGGHKTQLSVFTTQKTVSINLGD